MDLASLKAQNDIIFPQLIQVIQEIVQMPSVQGPASELYPYGEDVFRCLERVLSLAKELGFAVVNKGDYGWAAYGDTRQPYIGIFGHLDTVPLGEGWTYPPLGAEIHHNRIYGRGVLDNKGPILTTLFALYSLKRLGYPMKYPVRVVFGTNEETGFNDMIRYRKEEDWPLMGFTPDCKYPVVYAERGRLGYRIHSTDSKALYHWLNTYLFPDPKYGRNLKIAYQDEEFGQLEMRNHRLTQEGADHIFTSAISYPAKVTADALCKKIQATLPKACHFTQGSTYAPVYFDKTAPWLKALQNAYNEVMAEVSEPVTTTGGTYAKIIPNIVPFGPSFKGQKNIAHNPDEWMDLADLKKNLYIYTLALANLQEV